MLKLFCAKFSFCSLEDLIEKSHKSV